MQGIDADHDAPRVTLESRSGTSVPANRSIQRADEHATEVARALAEAGYEPRHLSMTYLDTGDLVLVARLDRRTPTPGRGTTIARLAIGVALGLVLGFVGLPRLDVFGPGQPQNTTVQAPTGVAESQVVSQTAASMQVPTQPPSPPTPTLVPTPAALLRVGPFTSALQGWTNDPAGTAWFGGGAYHLNARQPGQFVATRVPLSQPVNDAKLTAQFRKVGGPPGGGYGLIVRDQSPPAERDGRNQSGEYLVAEIGDRGDIGVWQRDQTRWIDIVPWTHSNAVNLDRQPNELSVSTNANRLEVQVNGQTVANLAYDRLPPSGGVGVFTGGDLNEVALDWLRIDSSR